MIFHNNFLKDENRFRALRVIQRATNNKIASLKPKHDNENKNYVSTLKVDRMHLGDKIIEMTFLKSLTKMENFFNFGAGRWERLTILRMKSTAKCRNTFNN